MYLEAKETYIWLNSLGIRARTIDDLEKIIGKIESVWDMSNTEILDMPKISKITKNKLIDNRNDFYLEKIMRTLEETRAKVVSIVDRDYPNSLKNIYDPPKVLYYIGRDLKEQPKIAIVGSRKMTSYGKWATEKLVRELSSVGICIVSGMALGIDGAAHQEALKCKNDSIGVLGNGIDLVYPKRNRRIFESMEEEGTILSEYYFGTPPLAHHFPERNRIISGISNGVLVIEAKEKSGSLITAHRAMEQGKEVFAVPGNINSVFSGGTNLLIKDGAKLVASVEDIIDEVEAFKDLSLSCKLEDKYEKENLSELELKIIKEIKNKPINCDQIVINTGLDISTVSSVLTVLEIKGLVVEMAGRNFALS